MRWRAGDLEMPKLFLILQSPDSDHKLRLGMHWPYAGTGAVQVAELKSRGEFVVG